MPSAARLSRIYRRARPFPVYPARARLKTFDVPALCGGGGSGCAVYVCDEPVTYRKTGRRPMEAVYNRLSAQVYNEELHEVIRRVYIGINLETRDACELLDMHRRRSHLSR